MGNNKNLNSVGRQQKYQGNPHEGYALSDFARP